MVAGVAKAIAKVAGVGAKVAGADGSMASGSSADSSRMGSMIASSQAVLLHVSKRLWPPSRETAPALVCPRPRPHAQQRQRVATHWRTVGSRPLPFFVAQGVLFCASAVSVAVVLRSRKTPEQLEQLEREKERLRSALGDMLKGGEAKAELLVRPLARRVPWLFAHPNGRRAPVADARVSVSPAAADLPLQLRGGG